MPFWLVVMFAVGAYIGGAIVTGLIISKGEPKLNDDDSWIVVCWPLLLVCAIPLLPIYGLIWLINAMKRRMK